jgi:hypothetical protein
VARKDVAHARCRDRDAELSQLADDAEISPTGVLPGQSKDELDGLGRQRWPTGLAARIGPAPPNESAVPVEDRRRRDKQRRPTVARDETGEQRNKGAVGPGESRLLDLAPEDRELVTQNHDLHVLRKGFHRVDADQLEGATRQTVEERQGHAIILAGASWHVKPGGSSN